jgi:hypothetical protein
LHREMTRPNARRPGLFPDTSRLSQRNPPLASICPSSMPATRGAMKNPINPQNRARLRPEAAESTLSGKDRRESRELSGQSVSTCPPPAREASFSEGPAES